MPKANKHNSPWQLDDIPNSHHINSLTSISLRLQPAQLAARKPGNKFQLQIPNKVENAIQCVIPRKKMALLDRDTKRDFSTTFWSFPYCSCGGQQWTQKIQVCTGSCSLNFLLKIGVILIAKSVAGPLFKTRIMCVDHLQTSYNTWCDYKRSSLEFLCIQLLPWRRVLWTFQLCKIC